MTILLISMVILTSLVTKSPAFTLVMSLLVVSWFATIEKGHRPYSDVRFIPMEDKAKSPWPNSPQNVIDLDSECHTLISSGDCYLIIYNL